MKDYVIIGLLIVILMILLSRRRSSYTQAQLSMLTPAIPQAVARLVVNDILDISINQTKGTPVLASVNSLIAKVNTAESSAQLVPYTSETQISTMFQAAYDNSEASLTRTDKAILRFMTLLGIESQQHIPWGSGGLPAISFTNQGKTVWADEIMGQTGLTIQEGIVKILEMVKNTAMMNDSIIAEINSILPSNLTPFASADDYKNRINPDNSTNRNISITDPSVIWFIKFYTIGPLYMVWLAENKWRIDLSWRLVQDNPPTAVTA
jgi:hypothetical protein